MEVRLSFLPGGLILLKQGDEFVITIEEEEVFRSRVEKAALTKFHAIRCDMEEKYPATKLTKEQKQEALKRLVADQVLRQVRNSTRKSKFDNPTNQGRFDNR
ncbi:MAG: hypothetical protein WAU71_09090 [Pyrinomonadaceae bacterium]